MKNENHKSESGCCPGFHNCDHPKRFKRGDPKCEECEKDIDAALEWADRENLTIPCSGLHHCKASEKTIDLKDPKCKECVNEAFDALERMNIHYKGD